jgi:prepilin-type N-terminal cleavage/methylation domain-containing protein
MKNIINTQNSANQGFTLIEVIVAIAVLTIGILSLYSMHVSSINGNATASNLTTRSNWASDRIEILLSRPYGHSDLEDVDKDGTNEPVDANGNDSDGGSFGLDDDTSVTADHRDASPDGRYTILWNVAVDTPVPNSKTIRVIVTSLDRGVTKTVPLTYIKSEKL